MKARFAHFSLLTAVATFLLASACGNLVAPQQEQLPAANAASQQSSSADPIGPGCGSIDITFAPGDESGHPLAPARAGMATVYVIQDDRNFESWHHPTVDWGIDGQWVGSTKGNTYFYDYVAPGEHHICAEWRAGMTAGRLSDSVPFIADAGQIYRFRLANVFSESARQNGMRLTPADDDEARSLLASFRHSIYKPK